MENSDDIRLIVKIAQLYYEQDMTQAQIARELGIYRTTISRLLKRCRDQGIVTIAINYDYNENLWLEQQVKQKFREGANKRGNSSRLTQSFHFFMFEPIFSPVNALNQPI